MKLSHWALLGIFVTLGIYLFVSAPPELSEENALVDESRLIKIDRVFNTANAINDAARFVYTKKIVGGGGSAGLNFGEDWAEPNVEKGPLPALFLRLVAKQLEAMPEPLGLYLGSDEPINKSNMFSESQLIQFAGVKESQSPYIGLTDDGYQIAMYPDKASVQPCVSCHNDHPDSPKDDWKLNDIMGATTWTYPESPLLEADLINISAAVYLAVKQAYELYLDKVKDFDQTIDIGSQWPDEGKSSLPDSDVFMEEVKKVAGSEFMRQMLVAEERKDIGAIN